MRQRDQRAKLWLAAGERLGAVNRVDHPHPFGVKVSVVMLFTEHAVRRINTGDLIANAGLDLHVGKRHRRGIRLGHHLEIGAEVALGNRSRQIGQMRREGAVLRKVVHIDDNFR